VNAPNIMTRVYRRRSLTKPAAATVAAKLRSLQFS